MALTLATWRRESKLRFEVFLDFSFQWDSRGRWELDDDASMRLVGICNAYHEWDTATVRVTGDGSQPGDTFAGLIPAGKYWRLAITSGPNHPNTGITFDYQKGGNA